MAGLLARKFVWRDEERILKLEPPVWRCLELVAKSRGIDWRQCACRFLDMAEAVATEQGGSVAGVVRAGCFAALLADVENREQARSLPDSLEPIYGNFGRLDARLRLKGIETVLGLHELNWLREEIDDLVEKIRERGIRL